VRFSRAGASVDAVPVDADGNATFDLDPSARRTVVVVAPTAPRTLVPGNFSLSVSPPPTSP
jgi:hypothetical protein